MTEIITPRPIHHPSTCLQYLRPVSTYQAAMPLDSDDLAALSKALTDSVSEKVTERVSNSLGNSLGSQINNLEQMNKTQAENLQVSVD